SYGTLVGRSLVACDEERALALGYALVALSGPLSISATPDEAGLLLPDLPLPAAYRRLLGRIAGQRAQGWLVPPGGLPSARALLARLGMMIAG
ncbi:MAG: hypothetical protein HGA65_20020, partial [Oscillochloris sp.]|nr:hypothetical protein [Oscillochloris sp.]